MNDSYQDALAYFGIEGAHPGGFQLTKEILRREKINPYMKVLDAGCGTGQTSSYLAKTFFCQVYSIDQHPEMIKKAIMRFQQENLYINLYHGSIEQLPFPDYYFDFIIAESSTSFTDIPTSLKEYYRVLKPDGILINIDMTAEPTLCKEDKIELMNFYNMKRILTEEEWLGVIKRSGFKKAEILKSHLIIDELQKQPAIGIPPIYYSSPLPQQTMYTHHQLALKFKDQLGYRVYRASKNFTSTHF